MKRKKVLTLTEPEWGMTLDVSINLNTQGYLGRDEAAKVMERITSAIMPIVAEAPYFGGHLSTLKVR